MIPLFAAMTLPVELMLSALLYLLPLQKRSRFPLRLLLAVPVALALFSLLLEGGYLLLNFLLGNHLDWDGGGTVSLLFRLFYSLTAYLSCVLLVWLCCRLSIHECLYCAVNAYLTQHLAYCVYTLLTGDSGHQAFGANLPAGLGIYAAVYLLSYLVIGRNLPSNGRYDIKTTYSLRMVAGALSVAMLLSSFAQQVEGESGNAFRICLLYDIFCCCYAQWGQLSQQRRIKLRQELDLRQQLWAKQQDQYQLSQQMTAVVNQKCHDLKHQISALRQISDQAQRDKSIRSLEQAVMIYDAIVDSGNKMFDTVLTEKSLLCEAEGIELTYIADGHCLDFLDPVELYTLVGNALDNAIEAVRKLEDPERKAIALSLFSRAGMTFFQLENYYAGPLPLEDGLPRTSKEDRDYHGFGLQSIRQIAQDHGGFLTVQGEDQIFLLRITFPFGTQSAA